MKKIISLFIVSILVTMTIFADDAAFVANWKFPIAYWFPSMPIPTGGIESYPRANAVADSIGDFDPVGVNFDEVWAGLNQGPLGAGYPVKNQVGNPASDNGTADFSGGFKVVYDQGSIYILIKYIDDVTNGKEMVELMWTPYLSIPEIATLPSVVAVKTSPMSLVAPYARYAQFGAGKASFNNKGYVDAHIIEFNAGGKGTLYDKGTNAVLASNLAYDNKSELGSNIVKAIYTIGFQCLTGNAYAPSLNARPTFDHTTWRTLNGGKGISFDIKIADTDPDDQLDNSVPPKEKSAEYWWNATNNDGWALSFYSGFLGVRDAISGIKTVTAKPAIFGNITTTQIELTEHADVNIYNSIGKRVISLKNTNSVDLSRLDKGVYIIRANNETMKFYR